MDADLLPWHSALEINVLKNISNNLHPPLKLTVEPAKFDNFRKKHWSLIF